MGYLHQGIHQDHCWQQMWHQLRRRQWWWRPRRQQQQQRRCGYVWLRGQQQEEEGKAKRKLLDSGCTRPRCCCYRRGSTSVLPPVTEQSSQKPKHWKYQSTAAAADALYRLGWSGQHGWFLQWAREVTCCTCGHTRLGILPHSQLDTEMALHLPTCIGLAGIQSAILPSVAVALISLTLTPKCVPAGTKNSRLEEFLLAKHKLHKHPHHDVPFSRLAAWFPYMNTPHPREPLRKRLDEAAIEGLL